MNIQPFNRDSLLSFFHQNEPGEKYVLTVSENKLRCTPLSEISFADRLKAWFGTGPLSLNTIANYISKNAGNVSEQLAPTGISQSRFYESLYHKCVHHNQRHFFSKVDMTAIRAFSGKMQPYGYNAVDCTYANPQRGGCVDFSYVDTQTGFSYVLDGTGHNNPVMGAALSGVLSVFNKNYEQAIKRQSFITIDEAATFVAQQMQVLAQDMYNNGWNFNFGDPTNHPAISFTQIVKINDEHYLISVEKADTTIIIKKANGQFDNSLVVSKGWDGLGIDGNNPAELPTIDVKLTPIQPGDTIISFSDGIGEFLTLSECEQVIRSNHSNVLGNLLDDFKAKIIEKGSRAPLTMDNTLGANGNPIKYHNANDLKRSDDICCAVLVVGGAPGRAGEPYEV
jgi:hypothetical protein